MSFFNPELPVKQKEIKSHHPWERCIQAQYTHTYKYAHNSTQNPVYPCKKEKENKSNKSRIQFTVVGNRVTKEFIYCLHLLKGLHKYKQNQYEAPIIKGVTSVEWPKVWYDLKNYFSSVAYCLKSEVAVLMDGKLIGGEEELKEIIASKYDYHISIDYYKEGVQQFANYIKSTGKPCAYLHISINGNPIGPLIFMLYSDLVPRTCQNFLRLCEKTKGGYAGTPVHRIVKNCWIQCGGFGLKSNTRLDCENFIVPQDRRGVLCMANDGRHVDCSTQFFVLLQPAPWMEHKYVAFGQLIEGEKTLSRIENVDTWYESPTSEILIYKAGVFNMDCHGIIISKSTKQYIHGHIEDLVAIGKLFFEELLERVHQEIELRLNSPEEVKLSQAVKEDKGVAKHVNMPKSPKSALTEKKEKRLAKSHVSFRPNTAYSGGTTENIDFDVEEYDYEFEYTVDDYFSKTTTLEPLPTIIKPEKLYYIPLTDVIYPGEIDSTFDLIKLLRGNCCLESDLEESLEKKKKLQEPRRKLFIPGSLLESLFEDYVPENYDSGSSLETDDENEIMEYLKESGESVSFAGPIIRRMANIPKKFEIFNATSKEQHKRTLLTDEELRLLRVTANKQKDVDHIRTSSSHHTESEEIELRVRQVSLAPTTITEPRRRIRRQATGFIPTLEYYLHHHSDEDEPTLKDYRPITESHDKQYPFLRASQTTEDGNKKPGKRFRPIPIEEANNPLLNLHSNATDGTTSTDYVQTLEQLERVQDVSMRTLEYAKKRPSMTISQYQMKNMTKKLKRTSTQDVTATASTYFDDKLMGMILKLAYCNKLASEE